MRKTFGCICYVVGALAAVLALQLIITCEIVSAFRRDEYLQFEFWDFLLVTSGHHKAYPNGFWVHLGRDLFILGWALFLIRLGHQQFIFKPRVRKPKAEMVTCPECHKKTYAEAYCRFCGFNLVTCQPSAQAARWWPVWKVSLLAYSALSVLLLIMNLVLA